MEIVLNDGTTFETDKIDFNISMTTQNIFKSYVFFIDKDGYNQSIAIGNVKSINAIIIP